MHQKVSSLIVTLALIFFVPVLSAKNQTIEKNDKIKNVILLIADGMGFEQVKAASFYKYGKENALFMESFPVHTEMTTHSADAEITDSAASGTAIATGQKVNNGVLSRAIPGDGKPLKTIAEYYKELNKSIGLITTVPATHATPASFAAHAKSRYDDDVIHKDYIKNQVADVLMGSATGSPKPAQLEKLGYKIVLNRKELMAIDPKKAQKIYGYYVGKETETKEEDEEEEMNDESEPYDHEPEEDEEMDDENEGEEEDEEEVAEYPYEFDGVGDLPHLSEMTQKSLEILSQNPKGFFLMVEGGKIDWAGHDNDFKRNVHDMIEFDEAVKVAANWAKDRSDTLIIATSDHETGGLKVLKNNGKKHYPSHSWSSFEHTSAPVPVYVTGPGAKSFKYKIDNTDIFKILFALTIPK